MNIGTNGIGQQIDFELNLLCRTVEVDNPND